MGGVRDGADGFGGACQNNPHPTFSQPEKMSLNSRVSRPIEGRTLKTPYRVERGDAEELALREPIVSVIMVMASEGRG